MRRLSLVAVFLAICFAARAGRADGWTTVQSMPAPKFLHGAATGSDGLIYAFGGTADDGPPVTATMFTYDFDADSWTAAAPLPAGPRRNFGYASDASGRIYCIGGYNFGSPPYPLSRVERYDPALGYWISLPDMPTARQGPAAATGADGSIYVMGGTDMSFQTIAWTEVFDPNTNTWRTAAPMSTPRTGFGAAAGADGKIYVFGGYTGGAYVNTAEVYDPDADIWTPIAPMNEVRYGLAGVTGPDGRVYAIGGGDGAELYTSAEVYDLDTNTWTFVASMSQARTGHAATLGPDGRIYAIGGESVYPPLGSAEAYTP